MGTTRDDSGAAEITLKVNQLLLELFVTRDNVLERLRQIEDYIDSLRDDYGESEAADAFRTS